MKNVKTWYFIYAPSVSSPVLAGYAHEDISGGMEMAQSIANKLYMRDNTVLRVRSLPARFLYPFYVALINDQDICLLAVNDYTDFLEIERVHGFAILGEYEDGSGGKHGSIVRSRNYFVESNK